MSRSISFPYFFVLMPSSDGGDRGTEYAMAKIFFAAANFKNASAFGVKRFGVLTQTLKRFT